MGLQSEGSRIDSSFSVLCLPKLRSSGDKEITARSEGDLFRGGRTQHVYRVSVRRSYSTGEVVYRSLNFTYRHTVLYKLINLLQYFLINPNLTARRTHLGRYILEQIDVAVSLLLMGDGGYLQLATTDSTALSVCFGCHGLLPRLRHGSSHLRGSSQWTVMT